MANRKTPVLGYLKSAVADNTAHSSIDRLLLENEMDKDLIHRNAFTTMNRPFIESVPVDTSESGIEEHNKEILQENNPLRMNPAIQDETAHRQSLMESLSQQPQHTMGVPDKPFEMRPEDALPIGGILRGGKGVLGLVKGQGPKVDYFRKQAEKSLLKEYEALEKQFRGRDIRKTLSSPAGKEQVEKSVLLDYILKSLKGKIKGQGLIE